MTRYDQQLLSAPGVGQGRDYKAFRTLYLMLGGSGMKIGMRLRKRILAAHGVAQLPFQEFLWLDTDRGDLKSQTIDDTREMAHRLALTSDDVVDLSLPFARVNAFRSNPQNFPWLAEWLNPSLLDDLGHSARAEAGAAQIRALGRLALEANFQSFRARVMSKYERLLRPSMAQDCKRYGFDEVDDDSIEVVVLCSLAGGTGSGAFIQAARLVRALTRGTSVNTTAYLLLPGIYREVIKGPQMWEDVQANAYAALAELNALTALQTSGFAAPRLWVDDFRVEHPIGDPFNQIYLVDARNDRMTLDEPRDQDAYTMVADALFFDFEQSAFGTAKRSHRCNVGPHLANTTLLTVPVEDGTRRPEAAPGQPPRKPNYVFRFPNAFGAFGLARVPFERQRLQRAAGAWMAERMFGLWVDAPDKKLPWKQVLETVVRPRTATLGLTPDGVLDLLLADQGQPYAQAHVEGLRVQLEVLAGEAEAQFTAPGVSGTERLDRLDQAKPWGRDLRQRAHGLVEAARDTVRGLLSDQGARPAWGAHLRAILEAQDAIFADYQQALRGFIVELLAQPRTHGLSVAEQVCSILHAELMQVVDAPAVAAPKLDVPLLDLDPGPDVHRAAELRSEADALVLPVYKQLARGWFGRRNQALLKQAGAVCVGSARAFLDDVLERFTVWCEGTYRAAALARCQTLFSELAGFIGERTEVKRDQDGQTVVQTTGQRTELRLFREAVDHARAYFSGLHTSYSRVRGSKRNAADLSPFDAVAAGVEKTLEGGAINQQPFAERLLDAWRRSLTESKLLPAGAGDPLHLGLGTLIGRAVERQTSLQAWRDVERALEEWSVRRLVQAGYLADQDAVRLLAAQGDAHALEQLGQVGNGASPWLTFDRAHGTPRGLQPLALVGTPHVDSPLIETWVQHQSGPLAGARRIQNDSGSVVVYTERMAFPLFAAAPLDEMEKAYRSVSRRGTLEILRRHTVPDHLDLPVIRPPRDPEQAAIWFKTDRLALEAVLLNVFEVGSGGQVHYTFYEAASHVRNNFHVPRTLAAIATKLREDALLQTAVRKAVEARTVQVFSDAKAALHAIKLALWTQNFAFPRRSSHSYLEHELAASVARLWREAAEQRQQLPWSKQIEAVTALADPASYSVASPVHSRACNPEVRELLALPSTFYEARAALRRVF